MEGQLPQIGHHGKKGFLKENVAGNVGELTLSSGTYTSTGSGEAPGDVILYVFQIPSIVTAHTLSVIRCALKY